MSHYIDTPQTSYGGPAGLSTRQRWEIVIGVVVVIALGIAAFAFVNATDSPVVEQAVQPVAQSYAGIDDLATRPAVPAQSHAGSDDLATRIVVVEAQSHAAADDLATRPVVVIAPEVMPLAGADDLATRVIVVPAQSHAAADDLATRLTGPRNAESDDLATR